MRISNSQPCQGQRMISPSFVYSISPGSEDCANPISGPSHKDRALVRAAVQQAEELAVDVEDGDRALIDGEEFARARRQLLHRGDDMTGHTGLSQAIQLQRIVQVKRIRGWRR